MICAVALPMCGVMCNICVGYCVKKEDAVPTNLNIDDKILKEAVKISGLKTKRETVNMALEEFVRRRRQLEVFKLFGKIDYDPGYDYKKARRRK